MISIYVLLLFPGGKLKHFLKCEGNSSFLYTFGLIAGYLSCETFLKDWRFVCHNSNAYDFSWWSDSWQIYRLCGTKNQQGLQTRNKKRITAAWNMDYSGMFLSLAFFSKKVYVVISIQKSCNGISKSYKCMWKG